MNVILDGLHVLKSNCFHRKFHPKGIEQTITIFFRVTQGNSASIIYIYILYIIYTIRLIKYIIVIIFEKLEI